MIVIDQRDGEGVEDAPSLRVMTLNIAHGRGTGLHQALMGSDRIRRNLDRIADYLRDEGPDVVGLQEVDVDAIWSGRIDQAAYIAERAGYPYMRVGINNRRQGRFALNYGNAVLSRHPIGRFENHPFGERTMGGKGCLLAEIRTDPDAVTVMVTHLDFHLASWRREQAERMAHLLWGKPQAVLMGDFNCDLDRREKTLDRLRSDLDLCAWPRRSGEETYPARLPMRRLDHILVGRAFRLDSCSVGPSGLSDHRPVVAAVRRAPEFRIRS